MKLNHLTDDALRASTQNAAQNERAATAVVLHHLREVDRRRLYSKWKYKDLKSYAVGDLKYTEDEAWLRISAMQFLKYHPELEEKVNSGALKLSTLVLAKRAFAIEAKQACGPKPQIELKDQSLPGQIQSSAKPLRTKEDKLRIIEKLENVSKREAIKIIERETGVLVRSQESIRPLSDGTFEIKSIITKDVLRYIDKIKGLLAHSHPNIPQGELIKLALEALVKDLDPIAKSKKAIQKLESQPCEKSTLRSTVPEQPQQSWTHRSNKPAVPQSAHSPNQRALTPERPPTRYIPSAVRHYVWVRDQGRCTNCKSNYAVQFEHITPLAKGGTSTCENMKLLCRSCNQRSAIEHFGVKKMSLYLKAPTTEYQ